VDGIHFSQSSPVSVAHNPSSARTEAPSANLTRDSQIGTEGLTEFRPVKDPNAELKRLRMYADVRTASPHQSKGSPTSLSPHVNSSTHSAPLALLPGYLETLRETEEFLLFARTISNRLNQIIELNMA
jgi:hypothetical protein